ncbi:response regulator [Cerasicoccus arenae]|uniref:Fis family transcriptional regulator n=1 Tax=Cerasicoccus arenae TaxID=424488 RepID=A0A8J3DCQ3_9BACT|nr:response regulator [Cerasicoccus arenae]MBK1858982.1 response regulator [Cerasicoccus arenae]GHC04233.1 Fis family transcriptional regulator [Cerasicoccus arenae]
MGRKILIVDDDTDFNQLLTDIFSQASYDVDSCEEPEHAVTQFQNENYDLVVTDQKMPGMSGEELIRTLKKIKQDVPIIMVSGYLDNDTIRSLIREGVGGVFLKPLNVFSLLKRTATLIEEREAGMRRESGQEDGDDDDDNFHHNLPFKFETFPAKDRHSREFAQKLYGLRDFKTNLVMVAPRGTDLEAITDDLSHFDSGCKDLYLLLDRSRIDRESMMKIIVQSTQKGWERVTFVIAGAETITREQYSLIMRIGRKKDPFDTIPFPMRFIFCVSRDLDLLYDERVVDDAVYMFMGTTEIAVPQLSDVPDDIGELGNRYLEIEAKAHGLSKVPKLELTAKTYLREQKWAGNAAELHRFMRMAVHLDKATLSMEDLERVEQKLSSAVGGARSLLQGLQLYRDEYVKAVTILLGDQSAASHALKVDEEFMERILS